MHRRLGKSRVWGRGYTTIPVTVRKLLGLQAGDSVEWLITSNGDIVVRRVTRHGKTGR